MSGNARPDGTRREHTQKAFQLADPPSPLSTSPGASRNVPLTARKTLLARAISKGSRKAYVRITGRNIMER